jgi:hypothetical protein
MDWHGPPHIVLDSLPPFRPRLDVDGGHVPFLRYQRFRYKVARRRAFRSGWALRLRRQALFVLLFISFSGAPLGPQSL